MHTGTRTRGGLARLAPILAIALLATACSGAASDGTSGSTSGVTSGGLTITDPWSRTSPMVAGAGAAFMVIDNTGSAADALVGGSSPVAKAVEVHESYVVEAASPDASAMPQASTGMGGVMMGMRKIDRLEIPAGGTMELKPGSYHVMLIELTRELTVGEKIELTLTFEKAGDVKVTAEVRGQ